MEERAKKNIIFKYSAILATSKIFTSFVAFTIIANTASLALDKYPQDPTLEIVLNDLNLLFFSIFFTEMVAKMLGLGIKGYVADNFNLFDCFVVIIGIIDIAIIYVVS